jgi:hypothetical protein
MRRRWGQDVTGFLSGRHSQSVILYAAGQRRGRVDAAPEGEPGRSVISGCTLEPPPPLPDGTPMPVPTPPARAASAGGAPGTAARPGREGVQARETVGRHEPASTSRGARTPRRRWAAAAGAVVVLAASSNCYGRAEPTGRYRPDLPPAALATGCYPLPAGVRLDLPFQVRSDGDSPSGRRHLVLQFDLIDATAARQRIVAAFAAAGFEQSPARNTASDVVLIRDDSGHARTTVRVTVRPIPGVDQDAVVQGTVDLDLPRVPLSSAAPVCAESSSTKRFADQDVTS